MTENIPKLKKYYVPVKIEFETSFEVMAIDECDAMAQAESMVDLEHVYERYEHTATYAEEADAID